MAESKRGDVCGILESMSKILNEMYERQEAFMKDTVESSRCPECGRSVTSAKWIIEAGPWIASIDCQCDCGHSWTVKGSESGFVDKRPGVERAMVAAPESTKLPPEYMQPDGDFPDFDRMPGRPPAPRRRKGDG